MIERVPMLRALLPPRWSSAARAILSRTFCFVEDAVEMIARAAEEPRCAGEALNIGAAGPEVTIGDVARLVVEVVGKPLTIRARPAPAGSPARRCPDMAKATRLTGWRATVSLAEGIRRTAAWYHDSGLLMTAR